MIRQIDQSYLITPPRSGIAGAIGKQFADSKWHRVETIANHVGARVDQVEESLSKACRPNGHSQLKAERRKNGKHFEYRIFHKERAISTEEIVAKISPIIEHMEEQSKRAPGTVSGATIGVLANRLRNLLKEWRE